VTIISLDRGEKIVFRTREKKNELNALDGEIDKDDTTHEKPPTTQEIELSVSSFCWE
jgi:hypothetical protein